MSNLGIEIAASGLAAQQTGMDTVSENLANASTTGYVAETPTFTTTASVNMQGVGDGVLVDGITQVPDQLAQVANQQAQGSLSSATALQQVLTTVQDAFPEPNSSEGISAQLSSFWSSWDAINQNPSSPAPYTQVVNEAQGLATSLNQVSATVAEAGQNAQSELTGLVATDNPLLSQLAQLNAQVVQLTSSGASPNSLIDQQNQIMDQLANDFGAVSSTQSNGTMTVSIGGTTVVQGSTAFQLTSSGSADNPPMSVSVVDPAGPGGSTGTAIPVSPSGTAGGLLTAINTSLPQVQSQLDDVANDLAVSVNQMLSQGYTTSGGTGDALFMGANGQAASATNPATAATIAVNSAVVDDPQGTLAVSNTSTAASAANNGGNAQAIAEAGSAQTGALSLTLADGTTVAINTSSDAGAGNPNADYTNFIQSLGSSVQSVDNQVTAETSVANAASQNLQEIAGVNTNQQMIDLINYQQAYQAAAQVVNTCSSAFQSLLAAVA